VLTVQYTMHDALYAPKFTIKKLCLRLCK